MLLFTSIVCATSRLFLAMCTVCTCKHVQMCNVMFGYNHICMHVKYALVVRLGWVTSRLSPSLECIHPSITPRPWDVTKPPSQLAPHKSFRMIYIGRFSLLSFAILIFQKENIYLCLATSSLLLREHLLSLFAKSILLWYDYTIIWCKTFFSRKIWLSS